MATGGSMPAVVTVVGGGASGTLTALHLIQQATRDTRIEVCEPSRRLGEGLAYSTPDPRHRLNVAAKGMSAYPDDSEHFVRWLRRHVAVDYPADGFAPRLHYAEYLEHCLSDAVASAPLVTVDHVPHRVHDVRRHGRRLRVTLDDGSSRPSDAVVLATGHGSPSIAWSPDALRRSHRFVPDPWRASASVTVRAGDCVLLVGAGLTMADMVQRWGRAGVLVHVVSRHGMHPLPHRLGAARAPSVASEPPATGTTLAALRHAVFDRIRQADGDWRAAIDGLRPHTAALWRGLDDTQRRLFLRTAARRWDRVRHRIDPALDGWLAQRIADGSLTVHEGTVAFADEGSEGTEGTDAVRVALSDGTVVNAALVLNCTGTCVPIQRDDDPLVLNLLDAGLATAGSLDLGFSTDEHGRLRPSGTTAPAAVWAIGPLRRGELWESTAIPELRVQAADVARQVVQSLPAPDLRRRPRDPYGLPLSASPAAARAYLDGLRRVLRVSEGAAVQVATAVRLDPRFALGHATLALLGAEWGADVDVAAALAAAHRWAATADERERRFIDVVTARVGEPGPASAAALLAYLHAYPEDALAVSAAVPTIAFAGATELPAETWALVDGLAVAYGDDWWYQGLRAFFLQEQDHNDEAADLAQRALAVEPASGHAAHARAHVFYETGDHRGGLRWLDDWIARHGVHASHPAHFSWHAALHELALCDDDAVRRRYDRELRPPATVGVRALVDSASLLWRGMVTDAPDVGDAQAAAELLALLPRSLVSAPPTPFVALHAALALAAAQQCGRLAELRRYAESRAGLFADTIAPLCESLVDLVHGDADRATSRLLVVRGVDNLGGSAAQREIVEDTLIHAAMRAGRADVARDRLMRRLGRRPSPRDERRCAQLLRTRAM